MSYSHRLVVSHGIETVMLSICVHVIAGADADILCLLPGSPAVQFCVHT